LARGNILILLLKIVQVETSYAEAMTSKGQGQVGGVLCPYPLKLHGKVADW